MRPTGWRSVAFRFHLILASVLAATPLQAAAPQIISLTPARGPVGGASLVTITGSGFVGATQVTFGGVGATSFVVQSDTAIQAETPAGVAGLLVTVSVTTPEGTASLPEAFGYGSIPLAVNDIYATPFNTTLIVPPPGVLSNDDPNQGGGWVAHIGSATTNGTLALSSNGGFTYTPNAGFAGADAFTYRAQNSTGFGNFATVTITVASPNSPQPPTDLHAAEMRGNRVTLQFTPPSVGLTPTGYLIEGGPAPGSVAATIPIGSTPLVTVDAPTGSYFVRVRTLSGAAVSGPSNEIRIFVNQPVSPASPESLLALVAGNTLVLQWRNTFTAGEPTSILLDVHGSAVASIPLGLVDHATFMGVPSGVYQLSVRATNASGSSFPSSAVTVTVPDACSGPPFTPTRLIAYAIANTVYVAWDPPTGGAAPTGYVVNVAGSFVGAFPTTSRSLSGTVGPGAYTLSVYATNPCGASAATTARTVTVP